MSAASTPVPRSYTTRTSSTSASRYTLFWPVLILMGGIGFQAYYQLKTVGDQLDDTRQAIDQMDMQVKRAQYEKTKFYAIVKDLLDLAPRDVNAERIVVQYKLKQLQAAHPELLSLSAATTSEMNAAPIEASSTTNSAPVQPAPATNTAPMPSAGATPK